MSRRSRCFCSLCFFVTDGRALLKVTSCPWPVVELPEQKSLTVATMVTPCYHFMAAAECVWIAMKPTTITTDVHRLVSDASL
jgi:hypothetical protein